MGGELPTVYYRTLDPFVALTAVATVTGNLLLGTGIALLAQRDVIHTAKEVASLDLVSGGRVISAWARAETVRRCAITARIHARGERC
jgi:alkanesulfonate monooxygenase SsuD/methylene tetrahydromethanopterin reductase-like flavin-dependent oxidoreductase (luciferase family)